MSTPPREDSPLLGTRAIRESENSNNNDEEKRERDPAAQAEHQRAMGAMMARDLEGGGGESPGGGSEGGRSRRTTASAAPTTLSAADEALLGTFMEVMSEGGRKIGLGCNLSMVSRLFGIHCSAFGSMCSVLGIRYFVICQHFFLVVFVFFLAFVVLCFVRRWMMRIDWGTLMKVISREGVKKVEHDTNIYSVVGFLYSVWGSGYSGFLIFFTYSVLGIRYS